MEYKLVFSFSFYPFSAQNLVLFLNQITSKTDMNEPTHRTRFMKKMKRKNNLNSRCTSMNCICGQCIVLIDANFRCIQTAIKTFNAGR